jgi:hypothetical protein
MSIRKNPSPKKTLEQSQNDFINGAPDGGLRRVKKGNKIQISITIDEHLLDQADALAGELGQSRAGFFSLAISQAVRSGLSISPKHQTTNGAV